jgi:hypothetical protein
VEVTRGSGGGKVQQIIWTPYSHYNLHCTLNSMQNLDEMMQSHDD